MFSHKGNTKTLILSLSFLLLVCLSNSFASENLSTAIREKYDTIIEKYATSLIPLQRGIAVPLSNEIAISSIAVVEGSKNIVALDSKSKLAFIKIDRKAPAVQFKTPEPSQDIFFLLSLIQEPKIFLVKGKVQGKVIMIEGSHIPGSLLLSFDLSPLGIVTESSSLSEVAVVEAYKEEFSKFLKRKPVWLGIQAQTITAELARVLGQSSGIVITNVHEEGPSQKAGLKRGDIITEAENIKIKSIEDMQSFLSTRYPGEKINLTVVRDGAKRSFTVTLEEAQDIVTKSTATEIRSIRGVEITEIPESVRTNLKKTINGVYVRKVSEQSIALGILKENDIIIEINRKPINSLSDFNQAITQFEGRDLLILLYRGDSFQYVIVPAQISR